VLADQHFAIIKDMTSVNDHSMH